MIPKNMKPKKLLRMKRRGGQKRSKSASLTCYSYQKEELIKRAHMRGMTVSYYLNYLLWKQWVD